MKYDSIDQLPKSLQRQAKKKLGQDAGDTILPRTPADPRPKQNKYSNLEAEVDGIVFDSRAEARRYSTLKLLEAAGEVSSLKLQPVYLLQEKFKGSDGKTYRAIKYIADFEYLDETTGQTIVEDVKGVETVAFKLKRKLFLKRYPDLALRIVRSKEVK